MNLSLDEVKHNFLFIQLFPRDIYEKLYHVIRDLGIKIFKYDYNECDMSFVTLKELSSHIFHLLNTK